MKKLKRLLSRYPILSVFIATVLLVMVVDTFFGEGFTMEAGLNWPASYNGILGSLVFAEIIGFIVAGLYAVIFKLGSLKQKILPWVFCMTAAVAVGFFFIGANDNDCMVYDMSEGVQCKPFSAVDALHDTYYYHAWDSKDYMLQSAFPQFAKLQSVFIISALAGNGLVFAQLRFDKKLKNTRPSR